MGLKRAALALWVFMGAAAAADDRTPAVPAEAVPGEDAAAAPEAVAAPEEVRSERVLSFTDLSGSPSIQLRGTEGIYSWPFGLRLDETVVGAEVVLRYTASPSLLPDLSHLRVRINGEIVTALPLPGNTPGEEMQRRIPLDPAFFTDYNELTVDFIGHYTEGCEFPRHSALWTSISGRSELRLQLKHSALNRDLALLPAPFFDRRDGRRLNVPMWLPPSPDSETIAAAGVLASWFGALANYRGARFPLSMQTLPSGNAIVLALPNRRPDGLDLPDVDKPTIRILPHPDEALGTLLVLQGRNGEQLRQAAATLVLGRSALSGSHVTIENFDAGERRPAYDAPRWAPSDRAVQFSDLVDNEARLSARGHTPGPIEVPLRLPPDLFIWSTRGIPVDLRYRYTAPTEPDDSMLAISIGQRTLESIRLRPNPPVDRPSQTRFHIPDFLLNAGDALRFEFALDYLQDGACRTSGVDLAQVGIEPDSSFDISGFPHFAELPDLAMFANDAYPFSRYADLAETTVVLDGTPSANDIETALFLLGRIGAATGVAAIRFEIAKPGDTAKLKDRELILVGTGSIPPAWNVELAAQIEDGRRALIGSERWLSLTDLGTRSNMPWSKGRISLEASGSVGAVFGFESPLSARRSVVAVLYSSADARDRLLDALEDPGSISRFQGDATFVREGGIESVRTRDQFTIGPLPARLWLWWYAANHPLMTVLIALLAALLLAWLSYGAFRRLARRRL